MYCCCVGSWPKARYEWSPTSDLRARSLQSFFESFGRRAHIRPPPSDSRRLLSARTERRRVSDLHWVACEDTPNSCHALVARSVDLHGMLQDRVHVRLHQHRPLELLKQESAVLVGLGDGHRTLGLRDLGGAFGMGRAGVRRGGGSEVVIRG